ncbi:hypothetical protein LDENG_00084420 [Lucifuga dentata]|nr:hypothetical protein LDENG_00084420 [Lucifuga dentata]
MYKGKKQGNVVLRRSLIGHKWTCPGVFFPRREEEQVEDGGTLSPWTEILEQKTDKRDISFSCLSASSSDWLVVIFTQSRGPSSPVLPSSSSLCNAEEWRVARLHCHGIFDNLDSAGSCNSVISMNSGFSAGSMEHLSAEVQASLTYLEKTIEALEVQEDNSSSNDEPEQLSTKMIQMRVDDVSALKTHESGRDQKSFLRLGLPTPLLLANGVTSLPPKVAGGTAEAKTPELPAEPGARRFSIEHKAETHSPTQTSESLTTPVSDLPDKPKDLERVTNIKSQPEAQVTESVTCPKTPSSAPHTEMVYAPSDGASNPKRIPTDTLLCSGDSIDTSIDPGLLPPPSDFRDEPGLNPEKEKDSPLSAGTSDRGPQISVDVEQLSQKSHIKKSPVSLPVIEDSPCKSPPEVPASPSAAAASGAQINPLSEAVEPRSPPAVAPKPKKLPSNIILKSHKASVVGSDGNLGHIASPTERLMLDPQRVRMEALRKLGLLKSDEADSGPVLSPKLSRRSRRSWASPISPISPAAPHTPTPPSTPSSSHVNSPLPASVPLISSTSTAMQAADILPAPAAFSDPIKPLPSNNELSAKDVSETTVNVKVQENTPPLTPPAMAKQLTPPSIKSATLEHSGLGLSRFVASEELRDTDSTSGNQSLSQLRNTRPRPASLGSGKEFSSIQSSVSGKDPDSGRSNPAAPKSEDSPKLLRTHGISVLICPQAENGEDRREALKKLGLLRD